MTLQGLIVEIDYNNVRFSAGKRFKIITLLTPIRHGLWQHLLQSAKSFYAIMKNHYRSVCSMLKYILQAFFGLQVNVEIAT